MVRDHRSRSIGFAAVCDRRSAARYPLLRYHGVLAPRSSWRSKVVPQPREPRPCQGDRTALPQPSRLRATAGTPAVQVTQLTPNTLSARHWNRLLGGLLYATSPASRLGDAASPDFE